MRTMTHGGLLTCRLQAALAPRGPVNFPHTIHRAHRARSRLAEPLEGSALLGVGLWKLISWPIRACHINAPSALKRSRQSTIGSVMKNPFIYLSKSGSVRYMDLVHRR
jgi:hypothetical protein